jgi:hypothetical protein
VHAVGSSPAVPPVSDLAVYQRTDVGKILPDGPYQLEADFGGYFTCGY